MKQKVKQILRNQFLKNVSTLALGTIISQALVVATSPLLTRIFSATDFGILQVFTSITVFFAVISTGRYELAIGLPKKDEDALKIIKLILYIGLSISLFYFLLIVFLKNVVHYNDEAGFLKHTTSYFAPLYVFFIAVYSALSYWNQRKKQYKIISISNALQVIVSATFSVILGLFGYSHGMIWALILGIFSSCIYILIKEKLVPKIWEQKRNFLSIAKEYKAFPKYMILSDLSLTASQQFIPLIFSILYSTTIVGFYALANRMIRLPSIVITSSIANVFRNDAIDEIRVKGNCRDLYLSTFKKLLFLSIPIYAFIFIFAPTIFLLAFGEQWLIAGLYARIMATMLLFEFVAMPLNSLFYVIEKQKFLMRLQFIYALLGCISIYIGYYYFGEAYYSLILFCSNAILFNIIFLIFSFKISGNV